LNLNNLRTQKDDPGAGIPGNSGQPNDGGQRKPKAVQPIRTEKKVGRNDPCPCGSGKKYKQCHGK